MDRLIKSFLLEAGRWQGELTRLRAIILECGLNETFKWKHPCYIWNNKNIVIIHGFKDYCALSFFKGALLSDDDDLLTQPTKNVQAGRQMRFSGPEQIESRVEIIKQYVREAVELEQTGKQVVLKSTSDFSVPSELKAAFTTDPELETAFEQLTPGRQRGYLLHFAQAKQSATRTQRIASQRQRILAGKGLTDCICGHSKHLPRCDGRHKLFA